MSNEVLNKLLEDIKQRKIPIDYELFKHKINLNNTYLNKYRDKEFVVFLNNTFEMYYYSTYCKTLLNELKLFSNKVTLYLTNINFNVVFDKNTNYVQELTKEYKFIELNKNQVVIFIDDLINESHSDNYSKNTKLRYKYFKEICLDVFFISPLSKTSLPISQELEEINKSCNIIFNSEKSLNQIDFDSLKELINTINQWGFKNNIQQKQINNLESTNKYFQLLIIIQHIFKLNSELFEIIVNYLGLESNQILNYYMLNDFFHQKQYKKSFILTDIFRINLFFNQYRNNDKFLTQELKNIIYSYTMKNEKNIKIQLYQILMLYPELKSLYKNSIVKLNDNTKWLQYILNTDINEIRYSKIIYE